MEKLFVILYPCVALISVAGYLPQIVKLVRAKGRVDGISLRSWLMWIATSCISLGYGIFHLQDLMFSLTVAASLAAMLVVAYLVIRNRQQWRVPQTA